MRTLWPAMVCLLSLVTIAEGRAGAEEGAAAASESDRFQGARQRFEEGLDLARQERWSDALAAFDDSLALHPTPVAHFNRCTCLIRLRRFPEAIAALEGYLERFGADIDEGRRRQVEAEVERVGALVGRIAVTVEGADAAEVLLDGAEVGQAPLGEPLVVVAGPHTVGVRAAGLPPVSRQVVVGGGERVALVVELRPAGAASLLVECEVPAAQISLDGEAVAETPMTEPLIVSAGTHVVEATRRGYETARVELELSEGETARVPLDLLPLVPLPPDVAGTVAVQVSEEAAEACLDGRPLEAGPVPVGPHRLEVSLDGFETWATEVHVASETPTSEEVRLRPTEAFRREYEARADSMRIAAYVVGGIGVAALGTALGLYLWSSDRLGRYEEEQQFLVDNPDHPERDRRWAENEALRQDVETLDLANWGVLGVGAAALVTGVVLFFTGPSPSRYRWVSLSPSPAGLLLAGAF